MTNKQLANNLKEIRVQAGLSQFDVAIKLGFRSTDRISRWESGQSFPSVVNLFKLAQVYRVNAEELYKNKN